VADELQIQRRSLNKIINSRGMQLLEVMESQSLTLVNGRTISDDPGSYTFVETIGKSTIDLVWCNWICADFLIDFL
jgi:hypothetical protein